MVEGVPRFPALRTGCPGQLYVSRATADSAVSSAGNFMCTKTSKVYFS